MKLYLRSPSPRPSPPGRRGNFGARPEAQATFDSIQRVYFPMEGRARRSARAVERCQHGAHGVTRPATREHFVTLLGT